MINGRRAIKQLAAVGLDWSGARQAISLLRRQQAGGRRVLVFGYHRVCRDFERERAQSIDSCLISRSAFERHVSFLAERFELATMSRALEVLSGRSQATRDVAVITFDDGYADVLENALPVLAAARAPATLYVSSQVVADQGHFPHDRLYALLQFWQQSESLLRAAVTPWARTVLAGVVTLPGGPHRWLHDLIARRTPAELERLIEELSPGMAWTARPPESTVALGWEGVRTLAAAGWEIGAHTAGHCVLTHLDPASMEKELKSSRAAIERAIRRPVIHFAYCNGYYNTGLRAALVRTGYRSAVTTEDRLNRLGDDPFLIGRRVLWEGSTMGAFGETSASLLACQLDDTWSALGFNASESGEHGVRVVGVDSPMGVRRLA